MRTKTVWFESQGKKLYGLLETPEKTEKPLILLLHGLTNSLTDCPLISEAAETLHRNGFPTFRFDYFGSGRSEGEFKDKTWKILVQNTRDALDFAKRLGYRRIGLWGRSLGGILGAAICDDPSVFASVFISITTHTNISFVRFFPENKPYSLPIKGTGEIKGVPVLPQKFYQETKWIDRLQEKHLLRAKNLLIIQGTEDKTVYDINWAKEVFETVNEPKKLEYIAGADHAYRGYEKAVINKGLQWFLSEI